MNETVPLPAGFQAAGLSCGIKKDSARFDLALFVADKPCAAAGVFTQNHVCGAPVKVSRQRVPSETVRAVIINSGNSNACTGERGFDDARWMTESIAEELGCAEEDVLVCSTGVIGHFLPREKLAAGMPQAVQKLNAGDNALADAAKGMMTTDTFHKLSTRSGEIAGRPVRVSGVAKGAAMIGPNMATMLSVILTDAPLSSTEADAMLREAVNRSFNCISVEGHTSTSDSVILLASGAVESGRLSQHHRTAVQKMLNEVAEELAQSIVRDAEGADHFIIIDVHGLRTRAEAHTIAKAVANGPLVKTAITGCDPNWGRIVSAAGYCGVELEETDISLSINGTAIYQKGSPVEYDEKAVSESMRTNRDVHIDLQLELGKEGVRFWTSDLTAEYVRLNSDYTT